MLASLMIAIMPMSAVAQEAWPLTNDWIGLVAGDWVASTDPQDQSQGHLDVVGDDAGYDSYFHATETSLFIRLGVRETVLDNKGNLRPFAWQAPLDVDMDNLADWNIVIGGISEALFVYYDNAGTNDPNIENLRIDNPLTAGYVRVVDSPQTGYADFIYLDMQVPYTALTAGGFQNNIDFGTPIKFYFSTATSESISIKDATGGSTTISGAFANAIVAGGSSFGFLYDTLDPDPYSISGSYASGETVLVNGYGWPSSSSPYFNGGVRNVFILDAGQTQVWSGTITTDGNGDINSAFTWTLSGSYAGGEASIHVEDPTDAGVYHVYDSFTAQPPPVAPAELTISKSASVSSIEEGQSFSYTITMENTAVTEGTITTILDTLPAGLSYVSGSSSGLSSNDPSINGSVLSWSGSWIIDDANGPNNIVTQVFNVSLDPGAGDGNTYSNLAGVQGSDFDDVFTSATAAVEFLASQSAQIDVQGNAISISNGDTTPSALDGTDFGSLEVNGFSATQTYVIRNTGAMDLVLPGAPRVFIQGTHASDFAIIAQPSSPIAPGGSVTFTVLFDPSADGIRTATLNIQTNDADDDPFEFDIQGTGTVQPMIEVTGAGITIANGDNSPNIIDNTYFGDIDAQSGTTSKTYVIDNLGSGTLTLTGSPHVSLLGAHAADFTVTLQPDATVAAGGSSSFIIEFDPSVIGLRTASVSITHNDADEDPYLFAIQGNGIGPGAPLACVPAFFHIYGLTGEITYLDATTNPYTYTHIVSAGYEINAVGYNIEDGLLYGVEKGTVIGGETDMFIRIDATGTITSTGVSVPHNTPTGDFDLSGNLHVLETSADSWTATVYDVSAGTIQTNALNARFRPWDMAFFSSEGGFFGTHRDLLYKYDPSTYTVTTSALTGRLVDDWTAGVNGNGYGAAWTADDGYLYVGNNRSGRLYKIDVNTGASTYIGQGTDDITRNDGASCPLAEAPLPNSGSVGNQVWLDYNGDGIQDNNEEGVSGITVELYELGGIYIDSDVTDTDGQYLFRNLSPSEYYLKFTDLPSGYTFAPQDQGSNDSEDSDADVVTGETNTFDVIVGVLDDSRDAGLVTSGVGDFVWNDLDQDGIQDAGEPGVLGVSVELYDVGSAQTISTSLTDADGNYRFGGAPAGDYRVIFTNLPGGYVFSPRNVGSDDDVDSDANTGSGLSSIFTVTAGAFIDNIDAGIYQQTYPEIAVSGNGQTINDGDLTPGTSDSTDFGSIEAANGPIIVTYTISNSDLADLTLTGTPAVVISGDHAADFVLGQAPATTISNGNSTTFTIRFTPSFPGVRNATVSISNNDGDEDPYDFAITGFGLSPEIAVTGNLVEIPDGADTPVPANLTDFGSADAISGSVTRTFWIKNNGDAVLQLTDASPYVVVSGTDAADFSLSAIPAATIAAGDSTSFSVEFDPSTVGVKEASLFIANDDLDEDPYNFDIAGTGTVSPEIHVEGNGQIILNGDDTPGTADHTLYDSLSISSGQQAFTYTIVNTGTGDLTLDDIPVVQVTGANAGDFYITQQPASTSLSASGGSTTFEVTFNPTAVGDRTATISIPNDDSDEDPYTFDVSGYGTAAIEMDVYGLGNIIPDGDATPYPLDNTDFGEVDFVSGNKEHSFSILNTGVDTLHLTGTPVVVVSGAHAGDFTVTQQPGIIEVPPGGGSIVFKISFNPGDLGLRTATISIDNDDYDENPYDFSIQGTGTVNPEMEVEGKGEIIASGDVSPSSDDDTEFGAYDVDSGSETHTFTITNIGTADLHLTGSPIVEITGTHPADFTVNQQPGSTSLAVGAFTTFQVTFDPTAPGIRQAIVSIDNDDDDENPYTYSIQGQGQVGEIDVRGGGLSITDGDTTPDPGDNTDFGTSEIGVPVVQTFQIYNVGNKDLQLTDPSPFISISGAQAAEFSVTAVPAGIIVPGNNTSFEITFTPAAEGDRNASISIANNDLDEDPFNFDIKGHVNTSPAMVVTKTAGSDTVVTGTDLSYTITITNTGETAGTVTSIVDDLPSGFSYNSGTTSGATTADPSIASQTLTWTGSWSVAASGQPGDVITLTFSAGNMAGPGSYTNTATADGPDFTLATSGPTAQVEVINAPSGPFFTISKVASADTIQSGTSVTYTISVTNAGGEWGVITSIEDELSAGWAYGTNSTSGLTTNNPGVQGGTLTWTMSETILAGETKDLVFVAVSPISNGLHYNSATVAGEDVGGSPIDPVTTGPTAPVMVIAPQLTLTETVDKSNAMPGDTLTYTITYMNIGEDNATAVIITEDIPGETTYVLDSAEGTGMTILYSHDGGSNFDTSQTAPVTDVQYQLGGNLAPGGSGTVSFKVRVD